MPWYSFWEWPQNCCRTNPYQYQSVGQNRGRLPRHASLNDIVRRAFASANVPAVLEPNGLIRDDGKRPDGMTLVPWKLGRPLVWDATCVDTLAPSHLPETEIKSGSAAVSAESQKRRKYSNLDRSYIFEPFGVETLGPWGPGAHRIFKSLCELLVDATLDQNAGLYLAQRISIAIQRENCILQRYVLAVVGFLVMISGTLFRLSLDLTFSSIVKTNFTIKLENHDLHACPSLAPERNETSLLAESSGTFDWTELERSSILNAYNFIILAVQPIGGIIADKMGGRKPLRTGIFISTFVTFMTPVAISLFGANGLLYSRYLVAAGSALILPCVFTIMSKWTPPHERTFISVIIFPGVVVGEVIAKLIADPLLKACGWTSIFYVFGSFGALCFILVFAFVYCTPNTHPFISESEKDYLNENVRSLKRISERDLDPFPWSACLRSSALWGICAAYLARYMAFTALTNNVPQFMRDVLFFDLGQSKLLSYMPYVGMWFAALIFGWLCDFIVSKNIYTLKKARRAFTMFGTAGAFLSLITIGYVYCNVPLAIFWMFFGIITSGAFYCGPMISVLDITEDYAGTLIANVDNFAVSFVSNFLPSMNGHMVKNALQNEWRIFFGVTATLVLILTTIYVHYIEASPLWWDNVRTYGYPADWKHGLLPAEAVIDNNGETIPKPQENRETRSINESDAAILI